MLNSTEFYAELHNQFASARAYLASQGYKGHVVFSIWNWDHKADVSELTISNTEYGRDKVEVSGRLLGDIVDEFLRRVEFAQTQSAMQLGLPTVEQIPQEVAVAAPEPDAELPAQPNGLHPIEDADVGDH